MDGDAAIAGLEVALAGFELAKALGADEASLEVGGLGDCKAWLLRSYELP